MNCFFPGFEKPSAIQQRGIVPFTKGLDVIQQAQSGTGKTATFCSGILQQLDYQLLECQALVLAPTRELAQQIEKVMRALGDYLQVKVHACVGGTSVREDQRILQAGVHVVVGTPGRVYDMLRRNALRADSIKCFVLDEADEMLSRGFKDQVCGFGVFDVGQHWWCEGGVGLGWGKVGSWARGDGRAVRACMVSHRGWRMLTASIRGVCRFMTSSSFFLRSSRWVCSLPPCHRKLLKLRGSS